jgi:multiple sugar transport system substrate-binding protein
MKRYLLILSLILLAVSPSHSASQGEEVSTKPANLVFMHMWWRENEIKEMERILAGFATEYPAIKVAITRSSWADAYRDLSTAIAGGTPPDVSHLGSTWHVEFMKVGVLEPLNDYVTREQKTDIYDSSWDFWTVDGKVAGVPLVTDPWGMVYRPDIFSAAGLDPKKPPTRWEQLIQIAEKLKKHTGQWGIGTYLIQNKVQWNWVPVMYSAGCPLLRSDDGKWKSVINTPQGIKGMHALADLATKYKVMPESVVGEAFSEALEKFKQGIYPIWAPVGMFLEPNLTPWGAYGEKWEFCELPAVEKKATISSNHAYGMFAISKEKPSSWKLIEWLTRADNMLAINKAGTVIPPRKSLKDDPLLKQPYMQPRLASSPYAVGHPLSPQFPEIMEKVYAPYVQEVILGKMTAEKAAVEMDKEANSIIERAK